MHIDDPMWYRHFSWTIPQWKIWYTFEDYLLNHMTIIWIYDIYFKWVAFVWPAVWRGRILNVGQYTQTVHPIYFIPAMLIGTILLLLLRSTSRAKTLSPHVTGNWVVRRRSFGVPHSCVVDSSYSHNWCLCCRQMEQSWRMWWTICSTPLQSQSAESMMPIRFICIRRLQYAVRKLNIVVCSCLARRLVGSVDGL